MDKLQEFKVIKGKLHKLIFRRCVKIKGELRCAKNKKFLALYIPIN